MAWLLRNHYTDCSIIALVNLCDFVNIGRVCIVNALPQYVNGICLFYFSLRTQ